MCCCIPLEWLHWQIGNYIIDHVYRQQHTELNVSSLGLTGQTVASYANQIGDLLIKCYHHVGRLELILVDKQYLYAITVIRLKRRFCNLLIGGSGR